MKKKLTALLLALALVYTFSLPVAAAQKTVEWEGVTYTVDTETQTIHDGESVYEYQVELYRDGYTLEITYPAAPKDKSSEYIQTAPSGALR